MFVDIVVRLGSGEKSRVTWWFIDPTEQVGHPRRVSREVVKWNGLHRRSPLAASVRAAVHRVSSSCIAITAADKEASVVYNWRPRDTR